MSVIEIVNQLLQEAIHCRASDIHLEPTKKYLRIRLRVDGLLHNHPQLPKELSLQIISRLKILAGLRTDEHQRAQDGRFAFESGKYLIDIRISIMPTYHGENAVLRLLSKKEDKLTLSALGFNYQQIKLIETAIKKSSGLILAAGPTGSGKTSTLYSLLEILNREETSIITIEDPIEYALAGVMQISVNERSAMTFANGLRAILRQDPDVIMVGEIRDKETSAIAINGALTGHLILSTLHTNDAATSITRLCDLGAESYLVVSTLRMIIAQRLIRQICPKCKKSKKVKGAEFESLLVDLPPSLKESFFSNPEVFYGSGCSFCLGSGFYGRTSMSEILLIDEYLRDSILRKLPTSEINRVAQNGGMISMKTNGFQKAMAGLSTFDEVMRVIHE